MAAARPALRSLIRPIQALDSELDALTPSRSGLRQIYGIGVDGAAVLLTAVGDNPERIRFEAALAASCGATPLVARFGNRRAN